MVGMAQGWTEETHDLAAIGRCSQTQTRASACPALAWGTKNDSAYRLIFSNSHYYGLVTLATYPFCPTVRFMPSTHLTRFVSSVQPCIDRGAPERFWQAEAAFKALIRSGYIQQMMNDELKALIKDPCHFNDWR